MSSHQWSLQTQLEKPGLLSAQEKAPEQQSLKILLMPCDGIDVSHIFNFPVQNAVV